jgi:pyruvate,water dikinase
MAMVAFSRHPVTQSPEVVINAVWGLGQGLVDGSVTPDTYVVSPDQTLVQRTIGAKETMVVRFAAGIKQVPTPRLMRGQAVLSEAQIQEVTQLTRRLEREMGWPVDVEAAYWQNRLYLLQCRPITA